MSSPSPLSLPRPQASRFQTHHEAAPPVRGRFPEPIRAMRRIRFTTQSVQHPLSSPKFAAPSAFGLQLRRPRALLAADVGQMLIKMANTHCRAVVHLESEGFARWASSRPVTCSKRRAISAFSIILISDSTGVSKAKTLVWADSQRGIEGKVHAMPRLPES